MDPSSGGQRTGYERAFVPGTVIDDLVYEFLRSITRTESCHVGIAASVSDGVLWRWRDLLSPDWLRLWVWKFKERSVLLLYVLDW